MFKKENISDILIFVGLTVNVLVILSLIIYYVTH